MKRQLLLLLLMASTAHGELFTWTDGRGTAHYTNSLYEVPARYRAKVKVLNLGPEPKAEGAAPVVQQAQPLSQPVPPSPPVAAERLTPRPAPPKGRPQRRRAVESDD